MAVALEPTAAVEAGFFWMATVQSWRTRTRVRGLVMAMAVEAIELMMVMGCKV